MLFIKDMTKSSASAITLEPWKQAKIFILHSFRQEKVHAHRFAAEKLHKLINTPGADNQSLQVKEER